MGMLKPKAIPLAGPTGVLGLEVTTQHSSWELAAAAPSKYNSEGRKCAVRADLKAQRGESPQTPPPQLCADCLLKVRRAG